MAVFQVFNWKKIPDRSRRQMLRAAWLDDEWRYRAFRYMYKGLKDDKDLTRRFANAIFLSRNGAEGPDKLPLIRIWQADRLREALGRPLKHPAGRRSPGPR